MKTWISLAMLALAAACLWRASSGRQPPNRVNHSGITASSGTHEAAQASERSETRRDVAKGKLEQEPTGISTDQLRQLVNLKSQPGVRIRLPFVSRGGRLDPAFISLFGLMDPEKISLQRAIDQAMTQLDEYTVLNATTSRPSEDTVEIVVKPFGNSIGVYDNIMTALEESVGRDRAALFAKLEQQAMDYTFRHYGAEERTVRITRTGPSSFRVVEETISDSEMSDSEPMESMSVAQMRLQLGAVVGLLPENFTK